MTDERPRVTAEALTQCACAIFEAAGLSINDAAKVAEVLVWANLRGVDSHGVIRLPRYLEMIEYGLMNPKPGIQILRETPATIVIDADRAAGAVGMSKAMEHAIFKAKNVGIGWALLRKSTHAGAIGYFARMASDADMIGLCITTSLPNMAYHGARGSGVATSPIAISAPGLEHAPLTLDMATGIVSFGKLAVARHSNQPIPEGWALTSEGEPTTDAATAAIPLPLGGPKGSGLALMFECLTSLLVANPLIAPDISAPPRGKRHNQNALCMAIAISAFMDPEEYKQSVDETIAALKSLPVSDDVDEILVPGERGDRELLARERDGIPIAPGTWKALEQATANLGVKMPETL
ncbi:MAG: Ldh family oxidoreductase [Rhodospirillales bacterium]|nr:Ldh family oxidoreductase [Rhodospirillales bacterium]